jgi:hypothetical protein
MARQTRASVLTVVVGSRGGWPTDKIDRYEATQLRTGVTWVRQGCWEDWRCSQGGADKRLPVLAAEYGIPYAFGVRQYHDVPRCV